VIRAPAGRLTMSTDFLMQDKGEPDAMAPQAEQHALVHRFLETDHMRRIPFS